MAILWLKCANDSGACCSATKGFFSSYVFRWITLVIALGFMIMAIMLPLAIDEMIDDALCFNLCIPTRDDPVWLYENWRTSDNDTVNPPFYVNFYIYNISNYADMIELGHNATLTINGPYTYYMSFEKYDVQFTTDNSMVWYAQAVSYTFEPSMSNGTEADTFWNINLPYLSGAWLFYSVRGEMLTASQKALCYITDPTRPNQACLFGRRNVSEFIFNQKSFDIQTSNKLYFPNRPVNDHFQLYFNCENSDDCIQKTTVEANYGLGGQCWLVYPNPNGELKLQLNATFCKDPSSTPGTDFRHWVHTGQDHYFDKLGVYKWWYGNESIWFWNITYDAEGNPILENIKGLHSDEQFATDISQSDNLSFWDEDALRHVNLSFQYEWYMNGVQLYHYIPTPDLYGGNDTQYFGGHGYYGYLNASTPSLIIHGGPSPTLVSQPYGFGVDPSLITYNCTNCPNLTGVDQTDLQNWYGSYLDVNPRFGKVLRGATRIQINNQIGQDYIFGNASYNFTEQPYRLVPETIMPYIIYNLTVSFNETQAKLVRDGIDSLDAGELARTLVLAFGIVFTLLFFFLTFFTFAKYQQHKDDSAPSSAAYSTLNG